MAEEAIKSSNIPNGYQKNRPIPNTILSKNKELFQMTATYDANLGDNVSKVRLIIGDTDVHPETDAVFTDEEITYFLTANANNINLASADALAAWMAKYATAPDSEKIGDYAYTQKIIANMNKLQKELREKDATTPVFEWSEPDLADGEED